MWNNVLGGLGRGEPTLRKGILTVESRKKKELIHETLRFQPKTLEHEPRGN